METESAHILVIDDESGICEGCRLSLGDLGHRVTICPTGLLGIKALEEAPPDLLLLDMKLPDLHGIKILEMVQARAPGIPVIVMTGFASVENAVEAMKLGAVDYLSKPFSEDELLLTVEKALKEKRLREDNIALRRQLYQRYDFSNIIGESPCMVKIFETIKRVAPTDSTVLLLGESGTGKELFAGAIHANSRRNQKPFIAADCSTFSDSLMASELFGHVRGAFTGAIQDKAGIFEAANGGTLFFDEVANLGIEIQGKLLRVMETQTFKPVGAEQFRKTDVRIIAATNRRLKTMVAAGEFREDLFYRLNVFPVNLPSLRERREDIPRLAYHFLRHFSKKAGRKIDGFTDDALRMLIHYQWPGNVRQLKNIIERLVIMTDGGMVGSGGLTSFAEPAASEKSQTPTTLAALKAVKKELLETRYAAIEKAFLEKALAGAGGNITRAAKTVGMQRSNFSALMKKHHLTSDPGRM